MPTPIAHYGYSTVYSLATANYGDVKSLYFKAGADIDADGSPHAYNPSNTGLDANGNAKNGNEWVGVAVDGYGKPYVQNGNDPAPGYYVSTTSLENVLKLRSDPTRYINSEEIPFIVLPGGSTFAEQGVKLGDYAIVFNTQTGDNNFAIYADVGPRHKIGEISIALAKSLNVPSSARTGGTNSGILYIVFPGSGPGYPHDPSRILPDAFAHAKKWAGGGNVLAAVDALI